MIHLVCHNEGTRTLVREALEARTEIEPSSDWRALLNGSQGTSCLIFVLSEQNRADCAALVRELLPETLDMIGIGGRPCVLVDDGRWLEQSLSSRSMRRIRHKVIKSEQIALLLWDAIQQECARAALFDAWCKVNGMQRWHDVVRGVFRLVLQSEHPVPSPHEAARRAGCHRSTVYEHWQVDVEKNLQLKDLIDMALLLHARRLKTRRNKWPDVARQCGTTLRHLRDLSRRWMRSWPGDRDGEAWVRFADLFRATFATLVRPRSMNA